MVGRLLHGLPTRALPLGAAVNGNAPRSWEQMGVELERFLQSLIQSASAEAWRVRD